MLPFLKRKDDGVGVGPAETIEREHDEDFDILGTIAQDMIQAVEAKDHASLKGALDALCEYIKDMDEQQDKEMGETNG